MHAQTIQAILDEAVGKDESLLLNSIDHDLVHVLVLITIFPVVTVYLQEATAILVYLIWQSLRMEAV